MIKLYDKPEEGRERYSQGNFVTVEKAIVSGHPDLERACTSHVERKNGTLRQWCKRLTRLTYAFSKKWENLRAALALYFAYCNFCRIHGKLRITPAMEAGITDRMWSLTDLLALARGFSLSSPACVRARDRIVLEGRKWRWRPNSQPTRASSPS